MRSAAILLLIVALFTGFCIAYNKATPYRQPGVLFFQRGPDGPLQAPDIGAPDERQHANYVAWMARGEGPKKLPEFGDPTLGELYQAHQPPLYYAIAAGWSNALRINPEDTSGGFNLRLLNTALGVLLILGIYGFVRTGFNREEPALAAAAAAAFLPMNIALHSAVTNDPLLYLLITFGLWSAAHGIRNGWNTGGALLFALIAGAALWTKTTGLLLLPIGFIAGFLSAKKKGQGLTFALIASLLPLAIASPWLARNIQLYGDPFGLTAFNASFAGSPQASLFINELGAQTYWLNWVSWTTFRSLIGIFGYMDIPIAFEHGRQASDTVYRLALAVLALLTIAGLLGWTKEQSSQADKKKAGQFALITGAALLISAVFFVRFNMQFYQAQARYLMIAIAPMAALWGSGAATLLGKRNAYAWLVVTLVFGTLALLGYLSLGPAFDLRATTAL